MPTTIHTVEMNGHTFREAQFNGDFWTKHNRDRTQDRISKAEQSGAPWCACCGAALNPERAQTVHIVGGGSTVLHPDDEAAWEAGFGTNGDPGDMGCWDLGPECAKLFPAAFRAPLAG